MSAPTPTRPVLYDTTDAALKLSIGAPPTASRKFPTRLGYFRAAPGKDGQWAPAARAFNDKYQVELGSDGMPTSGPKTLPIYFHSGHAADCLEIRYLAFGTDRLAARGDTNYAALPASLHHRPEAITAYPLDGPPVRFTIDGRDDPQCLGGIFDIPVDKDGKPTLYLVATLRFGLAEVGSFTAGVQFSTRSMRTWSRLHNKLSQLERYQILSHSLMLLQVRTVTVRYRDEKGRSHATKMPTVDLAGPIRSLEDPAMVTMDELLAKSEQARLQSAASPAALIAPPAPVGGWVAPDEPAELVAGEVVDNPDDAIPFGDEEPMQ